MTSRGNSVARDLLARVQSEKLSAAVAAERLESSSAEQILAAVWDVFRPRVAVSSSFQTQSLPLLHLVATVTPEMPVLFLDTGFHFPETLAFSAATARRLGLNVTVVRASTETAGFRRVDGELYRSDPDLCCHVHKVRPLNAAIAGLDVWITGIRRDQTRSRASTPLISRLPSGTLKACPLAAWTRRDVDAAIDEHGLPRHPLDATGFRSIGCAPCTVPASSDGGERSGRWAGLDKIECGLHLSLNQGDDS